MARRKPKWSGGPGNPSLPAGNARTPKATSRRRRTNATKVGKNTWIGNGNPTPETGGHARQAAIKAGKHALCGVIKKNGTPCGNLAGTGTTHKGTGPCKWHGGALVNSRQHQALVVAKEQVGALAPRVDDKDVTEMGHVREALRESVSRLRGWRKYMATLSMEELLTTEGMYVIDAERKERMAGARVAMYAQHMGLTQLQIQVEQAQIMELGDALMAVLDAYEGGHASHAQRGLMGALLRQQDYMLNGGEDPDVLAKLEEQVAAARAAVAGDDAVVDAEVVPEPAEPPLTVPAAWAEPN